ncbi:MAG: TVP38/TMEM64 family protein [Pseudomonadota bacterium]|nr:TVP38/TMEM64 family protein [Pseudomonadota bacterium]
MKNKKGLILLALFLTVVISAVLLPVADALLLLFNWVDENRSISWLVFIIFYVMATVLVLPGSLLTLAAGFLFGLGYGFAIVSLASTLGATCAFLVGRFLARDWVAAKLQSQPRFSALDAAVGEQGAVVVLLTRLSPIFPFSLLNYGLGLTQVKLSHYVLASWAGMIPGTLLYVYLGSIASNLTSILAGDLAELPASNWLFYLGLGATLILTIAITRIATKALNSKLEGVSAGDSV